MKILILCTGNSCRSQMAEGFLKSFDSNLKVFSAGTNPEKAVSPFAIQVMNEIGIDISSYTTSNVENYLGMDFDYVITVCDHAKETCPVFLSKVKHQLHIGFDDPAKALGTEKEIQTVFQQVRDKIKVHFYKFYIDSVKEYLD